jgi:hypothetical protein
MAGMFHTGDLVLVHTPYDLLPALVLRVEADDMHAVQPRHPHYLDAGQFFASFDDRGTGSLRSNRSGAASWPRASRRPTGPR